MHIDDIMREIDGIPGMDEFKALCHRLELAANNARGNSLGRIPLPNLVLPLHRAAAPMTPKPSRATAATGPSSPAVSCPCCRKSATCAART